MVEIMGTNIRGEVADLMEEMPDGEFVGKVRGICHRLMNELTREELFLLVGLSSGRLIKNDEPAKKDGRWSVLAMEFRGMGSDYTPEQLSDPAWCARELARLGYSVSFSFITYEYAVHKMGGGEPFNKAAFDGVPITYQLWGPLYDERGAHSSPLCDTLEDAAAIALYNVVRLTPKEMHS
jgi:hypothetical protein